MSKTVSTAPFDGIVTNLPVREGETVVVGIQNAEGSTLMTLADMSVITAEVKVDETDIVNIKIGQPADVTVDAIPGKGLQGARHAGRGSGPAALDGCGYLAIDHRYGRGQGFQGRSNGGHCLGRVAAWSLNDCEDHYGSQVKRFVASHSGFDNVCATAAR